MSSFGKIYFFILENAKTLRKIYFELDEDQMFLVILCIADMMRGAADTMHSAANYMCGVANTMCSAADVMHVKCGGVGRPESVTDPPYGQK